MKKIGLALGSGAARGLSQIGVMLWLKENGIEISCFSGTSIGSILGAAFAYGYTPEYLRDLALSVSWTDALKVLRLSLKGNSLLEWRKIGEFIEELFGDRKIEELKKPFACVATEIDTGDEYVFRDGPVVDAVRASACIPAVFPPVRMEGVHLVDGAVVTPVPVNLAFELGAEAVIGVNVNLSIFTERITFGDVPTSRTDRVGSRIEKMIARNPLVRRGYVDVGPIEKKVRELRRRRNVVDVFMDALAITSSKMLSLEMIDAGGPVYFLRPDVGGYQAFDFDMAEDIINHGYREAEEAGDELLEFCR